METNKLTASNDKQNDYMAKIDLPNGWTASIVCHYGSYGGRNNGALFEVWAWKTADHSVTMDDPQGWLNFHEVAEMLDKIGKFQ